MATLNNTYTKESEPITHVSSGSRAKSVFRIHDTNIHNVTITKLGLYNASIQNAMGYAYAPVGGVNQIIKGGDVFDSQGNLLDSFRTKARTLTVNRFLSVNNRTAEDILRVKKLGSYSYRTNDTTAIIDPSNGTIDYDNSAPDAELGLLSLNPIGEQYTNFYQNDAGDYVQVARNAIHINASDDTYEGQAGEVDLRELFPMLGSLPDVGGLGYLEIVLYYNTDISEVLAKDGDATGVTAGWNVKRPLLLYEVMPGSNVEDIKSAVFLSPIVSTYSLDDFSAAVGTQDIKVKNVSGKFVDHIDILIVNTADALDDPLFNPEAYFVALKNLGVQIRLDDMEDVLPTTLTNPADLAMHRLLTKGEQLIPACGYFGGGEFRNSSRFDALDGSCADLHGNMGPMSFNIKRRVIDNLTISLTFGGESVANVQAIVVPHVAKQLTRSGDAPIISFI